MKNKLYLKKKMITFAAAAVLAVGGAAYAPSVTAWATPASGTSVSDNIVVRQSAVDGAQIGSLTEGQEVSIEDETTGSDGYTWYQITFTVNGTEQTGWVRGDLLNTSDESLDTGTDEEGTDADDGRSVSLVFETESGSITLSDIPEEELALVSDRFYETSLDFAEGTITALQLTEPDELVSDDAAIVDYYYVYGSNEIEETGWYVYNIDDGSIQKNLLNMQYSIPDTEETESEESASFSMDSLMKMVLGALGVICLLLLILSIAFSVRYRRLRRILEEELDEDNDGEMKTPVKKSTKNAEEEPEPRRKKKKQEPEPAKVNKGQKPKEPVRAKQQEQIPARKEQYDSAEEYGRDTEYSAKDTYGQDGEYSERDTYGQDKEYSAKDTNGRSTEYLAGDAYGQNGEYSAKDVNKQDTEYAAQDAYERDAERSANNTYGRNPESASDMPKTKKSGKTAGSADKKQKLREDETAGKKKKRGKKQSSYQAEEPVPEPTTEVMGVDILDLDSMDDTDYEALLNRYLEEDLAAEMEAAEENDAGMEEGADYDISDFDASDIIDLRKLRMPDDEPEFYDDDDDGDDDLTFL